ncbi:hypothetical protein [Microbulbifer sp. ALW1]|nr:hypothetical protein [Microbulbifer sp. ALW1]
MGERKHMLRREDRSTLRKLAMWVECMMLIAGSVLLGILLLS